uniref:Terpene synthase n=1 Tax=Actinidia deliciosa TaxID=3627 RepID=C7SHN9_ACTDE|nr:terpene synthase [Actinidia deliciosa]
MEPLLFSIQTLVHQVKQEIFSSTFDLYSFVSPSAYDTAWLAMIPHPKQNSCPKFKGCLDWILDNQKEAGYWGECDHDGLPTIDSLPATLACMVALKTWGVSEKHINKGLAFIHANSTTLLKEKYDHLPRWFVIVFPAMVEVAQAAGLKVLFSNGLEEVVLNISLEREKILEREEFVDKYHYPPLASYLEALPPSYTIDRKDITMNLSGDGSCFQSPSATARAFLATGNQKCMAYLESLVQKRPGGVPTMYPMDGELVSLCLVNQIQRLGLAEHFTEEIEENLKLIYENYKNQESREMKDSYLVPTKIYKDSLAFRLLRMHGYNVTPRRFCWFLYQEDIRVHIEKNYECFTSALYNVYRATDLMFSGEYELEEARVFSRKLLEKSMKLKSLNDNLVNFPSFRSVIDHELSVPWIARLEHLDHRMWIEENKVDTLWIGKASFYRLRALNDKLMTLAVESYKFRQSFYRNELEELKRWSKDWGLTDLGFGRKKTTYCYYAIAASSSLPHNSMVRLIVAKSAILVTIADDFFDMEGSLEDLQSLTQAVQRWDGNSLSGHGKIIFCALDNLVSDIAKPHLHLEGSHVAENVKNMWSETIASWLTETTWSHTGYVPSLDEYLQTGKISVASQLMTVPALCFLSPNVHPICKLEANHYQIITKLLMVSTRLLNDTQTYEKELKDGKRNFVILHSKGSPQTGIEKSVAFVKEILDQIEKEFLEHTLMDGHNDLPKPCKHLHLSILRAFHMFYNSGDLFDSDTGLLHDINKAFYVPL